MMLYGVYGRLVPKLLHNVCLAIFVLRPAREMLFLTFFIIVDIDLHFNFTTVTDKKYRVNF
jgi:hypothetical protein